MHVSITPVKPALASMLALLLGTALAVLPLATASAAPTADFTFTPADPDVGEPVTFTFTGECDVAPCRIEWRWFADGGSSLGTSMGEGETIAYAFPFAGAYRVVARITNATSTHGTARMSHDVVVRTAYQDDDRQVGYGSWRGVAASTASAGGYRVTGVTNASVAMGFSGTNVTYVARTGPSRGIAAVAVDGVAQGSLDLYSPTSGSRAFTVDGLSDGSHRVQVSATGTRNAESRGTSLTLDEFVVGDTHVDDRSSSVAYNTWTGVRKAGADGGTIRRTGRKGASTVLTFGGTSVTWVTSTAPSQGMADVFIDGVLVDTVDTYAPARTWNVERTYAGLAPGLHRVKVVVLGQHNASSTGNAVVSDAFKVR